MSQTYLDISDIPKELRAILELLKSDAKPNDKLVFSQRLDWKLFADLCMHHRVYPIIYLKLKLLEEGSIPAYIMDYLAYHYKRNTIKMLKYSAVTEKVCQLFSDNEIRSLLLKGPALAQELYGDISHRTSSDLDILVPIDDLEQAETLLIESGYRKDDYIHSILNDWKWRHHHFSYFHPEENIKIELHWRLNPGPGKEPRFDELWKRRGRSDLTQSFVYLLGKEDMFMFLSSHGARHGWSRLRWLLDLQYLIKQGLDEKSLKSSAIRYHCTRTVGQALYLTINLLDGKANELLRSMINRSKIQELAQQTIFYLKNQVNLHDEPVSDSISNYHKNYLFKLKNFQQKLIFVLSFLYPYPEDKLTFPLPRALHFLYFFLRPFLGLWRQLKKTDIYREKYE